MSQLKKLSKRQLIVTVICAGALIGGGGIAAAATGGTPPATHTFSSTGTTGSGSGAGTDGGQGTTALTSKSDTTTGSTGESEKAGTDKGGNDKGEDKAPAYHSSVTAKDTDQGTDTAQDLALIKVAKVTLPDAARAAGQAVSGGTVIEIELDNESGNVVYTADVVSNKGSFEVVVDAGNGHILASNLNTDQDD